MGDYHNGVQKSLDRLGSTIYRQPIVRLPGQKYLYVFGFTKGGRKVFEGPFMDPHEADNFLAGLDDGEIFESPSRNLAKATQEIKAELARRGEDVDEALRRVLHRRGLERLEGRK